MYEIELPKEKSEVLYNGTAVSTSGATLFFVPHFFMQKDGIWFHLQPEEFKEWLEELVNKIKQP